MIELTSITKTYKMGDETIYALNNIDLKVNKGDFVAIIGPSGSGKTTLANIIGGLDNPDSGEIVVEDINISKANDNQLSEYRNKTIGFIFQTFNLQAGFTALENVMLPLMFLKISLQERIKRATDSLYAVGLGDRLKHKPNELSGGQRQRVSIARALAGNPSVIIADEPTGNLDSNKGKEIIEILKKLNKEKGITLIMITHDLNIAKQASRVITISDGKISQETMAKIGT